MYIIYNNQIKIIYKIIKYIQFNNIYQLASKKSNKNN